MEKMEQLEQENIRLKKAVDELTVLTDLAVAASSSLEVDQMLHIIVQKSIKAVKAEQGSISLLTEQSDQPFKTLIRHMDNSTNLITCKIGVHITGWVLKYQKPLIIEDLASDNRFQATEKEKEEIRSVLCVPIQSKAKIIGILIMINKKTGEPFNPEDLRLLSIIAAQSGQLIRNSQLQEDAMDKKRMEQELALARRIQISLLPDKEPEGYPIETAHYFHPATQVGGDYYDYFPIDENRLGIVIADVSGHGSPAAMLMTMVKGILHSITQMFDSSESALTAINSILARIIPKNIFITMMFLLFDFKKGILEFSNAGHNPIIHYSRTEKACHLYYLKGCALNLMDPSVFRSERVPLRANDLFFVYTDGVTEAINQNLEMFSESRLQEAVKTAAERPVTELIEHVRNELQLFTGNLTPADDILMFGVKIR